MRQRAGLVVCTCACSWKGPMNQPVSASFTIVRITNGCQSHDLISYRCLCSYFEIPLYFNLHFVHRFCQFIRIFHRHFFYKSTKFAEILIELDGDAIYIKTKLWNNSIYPDNYIDWRVLLGEIKTITSQQKKCLQLQTRPRVNNMF